MYRLVLPRFSCMLLAWWTVQIHLCIYILKYKIDVHAVQGVFELVDLRTDIKVTAGNNAPCSQAGEVTRTTRSTKCMTV